MDFIGRSGNRVLFSDQETGVVVDESTNCVVDVAHISTFSSFSDTDAPSKTAAELATAALTNLNIEVAVADRMHTIPKAVQLEARRGLDWYSEKGTGATPVGLDTAAMLASGGQIGIQKIRHIAKYFPRHENARAESGFVPTDAEYPSASRISWALWGGNAAQKWARSIVERENAKFAPVTASFCEDACDYTAPTDADISSFEVPGSEFAVRIRRDSDAIDRLYQINSSGQVFVWDDGAWDDLGQINHDINTYDRSLDEPYDTVPREHVIVDKNTAIIVAALMDVDPMSAKALSALDPEETELFASAMGEVDWDEVDAVVAAGDGNYTPEERSNNASSQVRDGRGRFAQTGSKVIIGNDPNYTGKITSIDPATKSATVQLESGKTVNVPVSRTQKVEDATPITPAGQTPSSPTPEEGAQTPEGIDTSGIFAPKEKEVHKAKATLPSGLEPMSEEDLKSLLTGFSQYVQKARSQREDGIQAAGTDDSGDFTDPTKSDVPPIYLAIVDSDDAQAVLDVVALVPANKTSTTPTTFTRSPGKWVKDDSVLQDLNSPTPPPVVKLDDTALKSVLEQVDAMNTNSAVTAAAPLDTSNLAMVAALPDDDTRSRIAALVGDIDGAYDPADYHVTIVYLGQIDSLPDPQTISSALQGTLPELPIHATVSGQTTFGEGTTVLLVDAPEFAPLYTDVLRILNDNGIDNASAHGFTAHLSVVRGPAPDLGATGMSLTFPSVSVVYGNEETPVTAAGGLDRNRGNAEKLRRYWVHGEGAAKIRWGAPGDWKRCVRHLSKYMGVRAKGYCQLRHKEALGIYTSTHAKALHGEHSTTEFALTDVRPVDMDMDLAQIHKDCDRDELFDPTWQPAPEIVIILASDPDALLAAGGADRNRGNAEKLRHYWLYGKGAAKIRWNTGGDWKRCVRYLAKYLGPRAKGYCALRHKEATGMWTGDRLHRQMYGRTASGELIYSNDYLKTTEQIITDATLAARAADAKIRVLTAGAAPEYSDGSAFVIPLVIPEGVESGDGRMFAKNSLTIRDLPLPLLWQIQTAEGHNGSVTVGRIDSMERTENGIGNARGVFDTGPYGREAERMVRGGFLRGVSADIDKFEAERSDPEAKTEGAADGEEPDKIEAGKMVASRGRVMGVTLVAKPAFQECAIALDDSTPQEESMIPDGIYVEDVDPLEASALVACGMVSSAIPTIPPRDWFNDPHLSGPTPLTVDDEGHVYGHIAAWHVDHIGMSFGTRAPRSRSNYAYFHTGVCRTDDGSDVPVGQLTLAGGHAGLEASARDAIRHYDDTASAIADVHAGEDEYGIWVAGALRPGTTPEQIRTLRASAPSGDWRPIKGRLELVAVCQVNVPGFPIARARVASGQVLALVAAGAATLAKMKSDPLADLDNRIAALENATQSSLVAAADSARERMRLTMQPDLEKKRAEMRKRMGKNG